MISYLFAGMLGGALVLGGSQYLRDDSNISQVTPTYTAPVLNASGYSSSNIPFDFSVAADNSLNAVVHIKAGENRDLAMQRYQRERGRRSYFEEFFSGGPRIKQGSGSGVIISEDGYIVTNNHVIDFADEMEVTLNDGRKFKARKIGLDPKTDLAVIKIEGATKLKPIKYGDSDKMKVGNWVLAVGNPFDLTSTVTAGIISAKGRELGIIRDDNAIEDFIQTDAAVNVGNSGGALVDLEGNLIGLNTAIATPTGTYAGYSFAIPVNLMRGIVDELIEEGAYDRPALGIVAFEVTAEVAQAENFSTDYGVAIAELDRGGSAQLSGLLPRDIIQSVDGNRIQKVPDLVDQIKGKRVGDEVKVSVNRGGQKRDIAVVLKPQVFQ